MPSSLLDEKPEFSTCGGIGSKGIRGLEPELNCGGRGTEGKEGIVGRNGKGGNLGRAGKLGNGKVGVKLTITGFGGGIIGCWKDGIVGSRELDGICVFSGAGKVGMRREGGSSPNCIVDGFFRSSKRRDAEYRCELQRSKSERVNKWRKIMEAIMRLINL